MRKRFILLALSTLVLTSGCSMTGNTITCTKKTESESGKEEVIHKMSFSDGKISQYEMKGNIEINEDVYESTVYSYEEYVNDTFETIKKAFTKEAPGYNFKITKHGKDKIKYSINIDIDKANEETYSLFLELPNATITSTKEEVRAGYENAGFTCK